MHPNSQLRTPSLAFLSHAPTLECAVPELRHPAMKWSTVLFQLLGCRAITHLCTRSLKSRRNSTTRSDITMGGGDEVAGCQRSGQDVVYLVIFALQLPGNLIRIMTLGERRWKRKHTVVSAPHVVPLGDVEVAAERGQKGEGSREGQGGGAVLTAGSCHGTGQSAWSVPLHETIQTLKLSQPRHHAAIRHDRPSEGEGCAASDESSSTCNFFWHVLVDGLSTHLPMNCCLDRPCAAAMFAASRPSS